MRPFAYILILACLLAVFSAEKSVAQIYWCQTGRSPGSVTGNVSYGTSINWATPNRSIGSDDLYSRVQIQSGDITKYLEDKTFSFSIPSDAIVTGIQVYIERYKQAAADIRDYSIRLEINGSIVGSDHGTGNTLWSNTESVVVYGSPNDLWGLSLTPADVNSSTFGVLTSVYIPSGGSPTIYDAYIDNVEVLISFHMSYNSCGVYNLPVELGDFKGKVTDEEKVQLNWMTYSEVNNDFFTVERSADGMNYEEVTRVKGKGNSTSINNYQWMDEKPLPGLSYYRLKQTDFDGTEKTEGRIVTVNVKGEGSPFSVYPNPSDGLSFQYSTPAEAGEEFRIIVQDYSGHQVVNEIMSSKGTGTEKLIFNDRLKPGVYTVYNISSTQSYRDKLLVKN
jgi:hypothetical protein